MIKVILKSLKILEIVSANRYKPVRLSELARQLNEKPSTVAGIVKTMTEAGYLQKDPVRGYRLGIMATALTHGDLYSRELLVAAKNHIPGFATQYKLYLSLSILCDDVRHTIMETNENGDTLTQTRANARVINSATGLVLLSHEPRHIQDRALESYGLPRRFSGNDDFIRYLENISQQGYAEIARPADRSAVAVPVWHEETVVAALGTFLTVEQRRSLSVQRIVQLLKKISAEITKDLQKGHTHLKTYEMK